MHGSSTDRMRKLKFHCRDNSCSRDNNSRYSSRIHSGSNAPREETEGAGGKIVMVTNAEFPPYEYHENNTIVGIDADIARAIADQMGMELEIQDMAFDSLIPAIQSGKADFAAAEV